MQLLNIKLFLFFFQLSHIAVIRDVAWFLSYPMQYILPLGLILWVIVKYKRKILPLTLLFFSGFFSWLTTLVLKQVFMVPRPFVELSLTPVVYESDFSFPSNHATFFAALAFTSFYLDRKVGIVMTVFAFLIGISRLILGVHTPVDILAGFCVGAAISFICIKISKKS